MEEMKIYIALSYDSKPLSLIIAKNKDFATVAFQGMSIPFHSIEEIDPNDKMFDSQSVGFILTSEEKDCYRGIGQSDKTYRVWKRGL